jgi:hypothetical protein
MSAEIIHPPSQENLENIKAAERAKLAPHNARLHRRYQTLAERAERIHTPKPLRKFLNRKPRQRVEQLPDRAYEPETYPLFSSDEGELPHPFDPLKKFLK